MRKFLSSGLPLLFLVACSGAEEPDGDDNRQVEASGGDSGSGSGGLGGASSGGSTASGGAASGGSAAGGTGGGSEPVADPCEEGEWTCLRAPLSGPYGSRTMVVPAQQNWVNTGLYLKAGEKATVTIESGTWSVNSPGNTIDHSSCVQGDLIARIGLHYKDHNLNCLNDDPSDSSPASLEVTADKDGILYLGALVANDLGETYETRLFASGEKTVRVESTHQTVPTVLATEAATYDFASVSSGWVEIFGEHIIVTLPTSTAEADKAVLLQAMDTLDTIYEIEYELRGLLPHSGQRIRFFPDDTTPGLMLAGNPVRMKNTLVYDEDRISRSGQEGVGLWGYAHELGHDFTFAGRQWAYQSGEIESWPNLFSIYAFEALDLEIHNATADCNESSSGHIDTWDAWGGLCFLRQFQFKYGWDFYKSFFAELNKYENNQGITNWLHVHDEFETIAGEDITPIFNAWGVPNGG